MKTLKILGISILSLLLILYIGFLFVLPNALNLNNYTPLISQTVKDLSDLNFSAENIKLKTTWNLHTKISVDNIAIKYPNERAFLAAKNAEMGIKLFPLLTLNIELSPIKLNEPKFNMAIEKDGRYDIEKFLNNLLSKQLPQENTQETQPLPIKISNKMPDITVNNYTIELKDLKTNELMTVKGDSFKIIEFTLGDKIKVLTSGELLVNNKKHVNYQVKIQSFLPKIVATQTTETTPVEIPQININPISILKKYNFGSNLDTDLKITNDSDNVMLKGYFNATELNYKLQGQNIDKSFLKLAFDGNKIDINSNLYVDKNEKFIIDGLFKNGKKQTIDLHVNSNHIDLVDIQNVIIALLDIANIKNDIAQLKITGFLDSNFTIKSDMKKIESDGYLKIANASIKHSNLPLTINAIKANLDFSNNKVSINDSSALVNGSQFNVNGTVDTNANANVKINANQLPLNLLFEAFAPAELKKTLKLTNGTLTLNALIKGKLDKIEPKINISLNNLKATETAIKTDFGTSLIDINLTANTKGEFKGSAKGNNLFLTLKEPYTKISVPSGELNFDTKDITIIPTSIYLNNSLFTANGSIKDYTSKLNAIIDINGKFVASDILKYIPKESRSLLSTKGSLPIIAQITSDGKNTKINGQMLATSQNYISILNINSINGKSSLANINLETDLNNLKINDIGFYELNNTNSLTPNFKQNLTGGIQLAGINGKIGNLTGKTQTLQNIKISTPNQITASIPGFQNSKLSAKADININGTTNVPVIKGTISIPTINIPDFKVLGENITIDLSKDVINAKGSKLNLNGSVMAFETAISTNFGKYTTINNFVLNSEYIDVDKLLEIMEAMPQTSVSPSASVPVIINKGSGNIAKIKSGTLVATNASGDFTLKNNLFQLKKLKATAYQGIIAGDVDYNIPYETVKAKIQGRGLDSNPAVTALAGLKDQIQGKLDFDADILMIGMVYEQQMKTLKGSVDFSIGEGQMGSLGRLEHFIYASNLISQKFAQSTLNSVIQTLAPKNTGKFQYLKGHLTFNNGWAKLDPIHCAGPQMSLYIAGNFNLLNNYTNIEILGRVAKEIVSVMGSVGDMSVSKMLTNLPKFGSSASNILSNYNAIKDESTLAKVPQLIPHSDETKAFQVVIDGNIEKPSSVRTFKWLASEAEVNAAKAQINTQLQNIIPTKLKELIPASTTPNTKTPIQNTGTALKEAAKNAATEQLKKALPSFWDSIE